MSNRFATTGPLAALLLAIGSAYARESPPEQSAIRNPQSAIPVVKVFNASEFRRLADRGWRPPRAGTYSVKVWADGTPTWSRKADEPGIVLRADDQGDDSPPAWRDLGTVDLGDEPVLVQTGEAGPRPALLAITSDPDADLDAALELVRGRVATTKPFPDDRRTTIRTNQQGADFRPPATAEEWRDRARVLREQLEVTLGLWPSLPRVEPDARVERPIERPGYTIEKVVIRTLPGIYLAGNLYRPARGPSRRPGLLSPHGHHADGRMNADVQARAAQWARIGCTVFSYDMVGYNDSKEFGHEFLNDRLEQHGLSLATLQTWNSMRALDFLSALPDVDPSRIACTGESGGGTQTFLLAALDPRVRYAAPVVMVSEGFQGGCVCENAAGLRWGTDNVAIAALAAPRPMILVGATGDWTANTMFHATPALRSLYGLLGAPADFESVVFDFGHNYNRTSRNAVYPFLADRLLGPSTSVGPIVEAEGAIPIEPAETLLVFDDDHPAPSDRAEPSAIESTLIDAQRAHLAHVFDDGDPDAIGALRRCLAIRLGVRVPDAADLAAQPLRRVERDGLVIEHALIGRAYRGERVPAVRITPEDSYNGRVVVVATAHGKAGLLGEDGRPRPLVAELLDRGIAVVGYDPLFVGESYDPDAPTAARPETAHFDCYNKSLAAEQAQDLATTVAWARLGVPGVRDVGLVAEGRSGALALVTLPMLPGVSRAAINLHGGGNGRGDGGGDGDGSIVDLPGFDQFGGLDGAALLAAPTPLWLTRGDDLPFGDRIRNAYARAGAAESLRIDSGRVEPAAIAAWLDEGGK